MTENMIYGVAPKTRIPLHTMNQKKCFWIPKMVVFERHSAKQYVVRSGVALQTHVPVHAVASKGVFGDLKWWCLKRTLPKILVWALGSRPKTHIPLHPMGQQRWFWIPKMVVFERHHAKKYVVSGAEMTHTCADHGPANVLWDT